MLLFVPVGLSCSSDEPLLNAADHADVQPFPTTIMLTSEDLGMLEANEPSGILRFGKAPASLANVKVGSIIVAGATPKTPIGLLRGVGKVERNGDSLMLKTALVPIQVAFRKVDVRFSRKAAVAQPAMLTALGQQSVTGKGSRISGGKLPGRGAGGLSPQATGSYDVTVPFNYTLFDGDGDANTTNDRIVVRGDLGGGFDYGFSLSVNWGAVSSLPDAVSDCLESLADIVEGELPDCSINALLPEVKASFAVQPKVHASASVAGAAILEYERSEDLASAQLGIIPIGPLVFVPVVDLTAKLEGGASAYFETGVHGEVVFETAVTVSSKNGGAPMFEPPKLKSTDLGANETKVGLRAEAKASIGARLNVLLFGITGPYATALAFGKVAANVLDNPCWDLKAGLDFNLGIKVTTPTLPVLGQVTLVDWTAATINALELDIASGSCSPPPMPRTIPPGTGPDAMRLAMPTFTPWGRYLGSPVEGSIAGTPGNATTFVDSHHSIDGNYVRGGWGTKTLTKMGEAGNLVWARDLKIDDGGTLRPYRIRPTRDAGLMVLSTTPTAPIVLMRVNQDGSASDTRVFDVGGNDCNTTPGSLTSDGSGGFFVSGTCGGKKGYLLHAPARGSGEPRAWLLSSDSALTVFTLESSATIEKDVFLTGTLNLMSQGDRLFALRLRPNGEVVYSKRYDGCMQAPDAVVSQVIVGDVNRGEVTLAGSGGAQHNGFIARLRPDGSVGFANAPGFGFGLGSVFVLDSFVELPTSGYIAGGSSVRFTDPGMAESTPSAILVGFDGAGRVLWANRYTFGTTGNFAASGDVAVHATDDGGIFASALAVNKADALGGFLWAFKAFAKDGTIMFAPGRVTVGSAGISDNMCGLTGQDLAVTITPTAVTATDRSASSLPASLQIISIAPPQ